MAAARAEIARLRSENALLKASGHADGPVHRSQRAPSLFGLGDEVPLDVDSRSGPDAKIRLYRSLFAGREDVYATRWENSSGTKSGWSPKSPDGSAEGSAPLPANGRLGGVGAPVGSWRVAENGWLYVIEDPGRAGRTVVTISVTDLDQLVDELSGREISAGPIEAVGDAGRKANVVDADGNVISWIQVAAAG